jgi:hypothetical protein
MSSRHKTRNPPNRRNCLPDCTEPVPPRLGHPLPFLFRHRRFPERSFFETPHTHHRPNVLITNPHSFSNLNGQACVLERILFFDHDVRASVDVRLIPSDLVASCG